MKPIYTIAAAIVASTLVSCTYTSQGGATNRQPL